MHQFYEQKFECAERLQGLQWQVVGEIKVRFKTKVHISRTYLSIYSQIC